MIGLTIEKLSSMSRQDADALRAIAECYHPLKRNENMDVSTLKVGVQRGMPGALETLAELNDMVLPAADTTPAPSGASSVAALAEAITNAAVKRGIIASGTPLSGPQLVMLCGDLATTTAPVGGTPDAIVINDTPAQVASLAPMVDAGAAIRKAQVDLGAAFMRSVQDTAARVGATAKLHPDDNPAAGAPDQHALADQVFSGGAIPTSENVKTIIAPNVIPPLVKDTTGERHDWIETQPGSPHFDGAAAYEAHLERTSGQPDPLAVFSGGAVHTATIMPISISIVSGEPDGASVFAPGVSVPNVHAAIPTPPPLPLVTPQTLPLQSDAATTVSPPPPPPPVPGPASASAGVATTSPAQVELDKAGLPWDGRIHASTKTKTAKDVWTRRRGVDDTLVAEVEAQLRAAMAVPAPPVPPAIMDEQSGAVAAPAPTFPTLMSFITERIGAGRLNQTQVTAAVQAVGLESLNLVMARVDLVPAIMDELRKVAP